MAWTSPMTFVDGSVLTASQLNTHLRDNLMETMPARASATSQYFVSDAKNRIVARLGGKHTVLAQESTSSTEYSDLATVGPQVTIMTGASVIVFFGCNTIIGTSTATCCMSIAVSSATEGGIEIEPSDTYCIAHGGESGGPDQIQGSHHVSFFNSLTPGLNTITAKYRSTIDGENATFLRRRISVMPVT